VLIAILDYWVIGGIPWSGTGGGITVLMHCLRITTPVTTRRCYVAILQTIPVRVTMNLLFRYRALRY